MGREATCRASTRPGGAEGGATGRWVRNTKRTRVFFLPTSVSPFLSSMSEFLSFKIPAQSMLRNVRFFLLHEFEPEKLHSTCLCSETCLMKLCITETGVKERCKTWSGHIMLFAQLHMWFLDSARVALLHSQLQNNAYFAQSRFWCNPSVHPSSFSYSPFKATLPLISLLIGCPVYYMSYTVYNFTIVDSCIRCEKALLNLLKPKCKHEPKFRLLEMLGFGQFFCSWICMMSLRADILKYPKIWSCKWASQIPFKDFFYIYIYENIN